jgi:hypothetical protein
MGSQALNGDTDDVIRVGVAIEPEVGPHVGASRGTIAASLAVRITVRSATSTVMMVPRPGRQRRHQRLSREGF